MRSGVSPIISAVLLIAFTLTVASISAPFFTGNLERSTDSVDESAGKIMDATGMVLELRNVNYDAVNNNLSISVQNRGDQTAENIVVSFLGKTAYTSEFPVKISTGGIKQFEISLENPQDLNSVDVSLRDYPVSQEKEMVCRRPTPTEERRYIVNNYHAGRSLTVVSYEDNNNVTAGSCSKILDKGQVHTFSDTCYSTGATVSGPSAFSAHFNAGGSDGPVPENFAGKEFVYEDCRGQEWFNIYSPYADASVTISNATGTVTTANVPKGGHTEINTAMPDHSVYTITSDEKILVTYDRNMGDTYMMHPASDNLWGLMEDLVVSKDNTHVTVYNSEGGKAVDGKYNKYDHISLGPGSQGGWKTFHAEANKTALGASRCADGDNGETDIAIPEDRTATEFRLPEPIYGIDNKNKGRYLTFTLTGAGTCTVYDSSGKQVASESTSNSRPHPGFITFNTEEDFNLTSAGGTVRCSVPAALQWEPSQDEGESNLYGAKDSAICSLRN